MVYCHRSGQRIPVIHRCGLLSLLVSGVAHGLVGFSSSSTLTALAMVETPCGLAGSLRGEALCVLPHSKPVRLTLCLCFVFRHNTITRFQKTNLSLSLNLCVTTAILSLWRISNGVLTATKQCWTCLNRAQRKQMMSFLGLGGYCWISDCAQISQPLYHRRW